VRRANDRAVLSRANPKALWRLARFVGVRRAECHCTKCLTALVEYLARRLETSATDTTSRS